MSSRVIIPCEAAAAAAAETLGFYPEQLAQHIADPSGLRQFHIKADGGELYTVDTHPDVILRREDVYLPWRPTDPEQLGEYLRWHASELGMLAIQPNVSIITHYAAIATRPGDTALSIFTPAQRIELQPMVRGWLTSLNQGPHVRLCNRLIDFYLTPRPQPTIRRAGDLSKREQWSYQRGGGGQSEVFTLIDVDSMLVDIIEGLRQIERQSEEMSPLSPSVRSLGKRLHVAKTEARSKYGYSQESLYY